MFEGQPKGLWALALANTGERFGYYTMLAVFLLYLQANFGFTTGAASTIYSTFLMMVYFLPVIGGIAADKFGFGKMVTTGIFIMFIGYLLLSAPLGSNTVAIVAMGLALILISLGTGLFKGNLQVMVGKLYDEPRFADKRDSGFSLFYMAINIGAMFAPTAAIKIMEWAQESLGQTEAESYHFAFAVACASLIVSIAIYYAFSGTYKHVLANEKKAEKANVEKTKVQELSPAETKERIVCLCLVFAVVIFFWMAFHQNGNTLTLFARDYTQTQSFGLQSMAFDVTNLVACIFIVYGLFGLFQSKTNQGKAISSAVILLPALFLAWKYTEITPEGVKVVAPIFQQFNPCYVVALTPVSVALFGWLNRKGKEPSSPRKIGLGMLVAAAAFLLMMTFSFGLLTPLAQADAIAAGEDPARVSANLLISTYLVLTFAELLLSPIGISFVSKVAPAKYAGLMMGLWFAATAIGNQLVMIPGLLWGADVSLPVIWGVLAGNCLLSAAFIFAIIKKLEKVA